MSAFLLERADFFLNEQILRGALAPPLADRHVTTTISVPLMTFVVLMKHFHSFRPVGDYTDGVSCDEYDDVNGDCAIGRECVFNEARTQPPWRLL